MIRTTSFVLGFLIAASSVYYVVFWGHFNIDVFQYLQSADIIKGLAYPIKDSYEWLLFLLIEFAVTIFYVLYSSEKERNLSQPMAITYYRRAVEFLFKVTGGVFIIALVFSIIYYSIVTKNTSLQYAVSLSKLTIPLIVLTAILAYSMLEYKSKLKYLESNKPVEVQSDLIRVLDLFLIMFTVYFFAAEISYGMINSRKIEAEMAYDYVVPNDILIKDGLSATDTLIYLGAISDRYVFLKRNKSAYFVVDKGHLPVLLINHESRKNKDSSIVDELIRNAKKNALVFDIVCTFLILFLLLIFYKLFVWILAKVVDIVIIEDYSTIEQKDRIDEVRKTVNKWLKKRLALRRRRLRKESMS